MQLITRTHSTTTVSRSARRVAQRTTLAACAIAVLATPGLAPAADTVIVPSPVAEVAALDGTVVWVRGDTSGFDEARNTDQVLMQRSGGVSRRVKGAPRAGYQSIDLGRDREGKLVLTYQRCTVSKCTATMDNLRGRRSSFKQLTLKRCELRRAPAVWGARLAYGLSCRKPNGVSDDKRTGLYVKNGAGTPRHLQSPANVRGANIHAVDLRGSRVSAIADGRETHAFTQTVGGKGLHSVRVALSEGERPSNAMFVTQGAQNVMWTLNITEPVGAPVGADIFELLSSCYKREVLVTPFSAPERQRIVPAVDLAVDRTAFYLVVEGGGIVKHEFAPEAGCTKL